MPSPHDNKGKLRKLRKNNYFKADVKKQKEKRGRFVTDRECMRPAGVKTQMNSVVVIWVVTVLSTKVMDALTCDDMKCVY
eukprot:SAG31_NODE_7408_length_1696_cov_1.821540_1_plen_80_part_00